MYTQKQRLLAQCCRAYGMDKENAMGVLALLKEEPNQDKMLDWMSYNPSANKQEVLETALQIAGYK